MFLNFFLRFLFFLIALLLVNKYGNDYQTLEYAYSIQQESFGYYFIYLGALFHSLGLDYFSLHFSYALLFSVSLALVSKNFLLLIVIIVISGDVLNEQIRFFSAFFLTLALSRVSVLLSFFSFFIHPAAFLISIITVLLSNAIKNFRTSTILLLFTTALIFSYFLRPLVIFIGSLLGYGYVGTKFLEPISFFGLVFIMSVSLMLIFYTSFQRSGFYKNLSSDEALLLSLCVMAISSFHFAILSGRLLLILVIYFLGVGVTLKIKSTKKVSNNYNYSLLLSVFMSFIFVSIWFFKYLER